MTLVRVLALGFIVVLFLVSGVSAFAPPGIGGGNGGDGPPTNNGTHTPQWYSDKADENNQEICMQSENHVVDKEGVCSCDEGWTGYPDCLLMGPIDNCVSVRSEDVTRTNCVILYPFTCEEELSISWVLTLSHDEEPDSGDVSEIKFSGLVSLDPKFDQQSVCAKSKVDLSTFSVEQAVDVEYCFYVSDIVLVDGKVYANVTYVYEELMARVSISESRIEFGTLSADAVPCGSDQYHALPCELEPLPDTFTVDAGGNQENVVVAAPNTTCVYVKTARMVYPLCCAGVVMSNCADEPTATAMCMEGLEIRVPLEEPQTGEDTVQKRCGNIGDLEVCLGVTDYRIDVDKDSHRGVSGVYQVQVTLPDSAMTSFDLGSFEHTFPMCGHDCSYEPGVNGWWALMWVIIMNVLTVGGFLVVVAAAHFGYVRWKKSKKSTSDPDGRDLAMVSLLGESIDDDDDGKELEMEIEEEEDDLLG